MVVDGNDSLRPGAVPRDQWPACPISLYPSVLCVTSIRIITPSVGPNAPVSCQYLAPVPGEGGGTISAGHGPWWEKLEGNGQRQTTGRRVLNADRRLTVVKIVTVGGKVGRKGQVSSLKRLVSLSFSHRYLLGK